MWVSNSKFAELVKTSFASVLLTRFTHNLSHSLKGLNQPLTWGYSTFPQITALVTTTTYNYIKTHVRFPLINFQFIQLLKIKTCKVLLQREG
jgi:hypothetical protein